MSGAGRGAVAALVVSHDGASWLPVVIDGLRSQTRGPDRVVCIDTGSRDESPDLLGAAFGTVRSMSAGTGFPTAVRAGTEEAGDVEWLWILHDDCTPAPDALERLLAAADEHPEADLLGPKLREWPSLRRLLEVGVTLSGTGRRETGLERGEYDQGQHDDVRRVLAVNSAGLLVRREVLEELGGFDDHLPVFGNDVDLGWRAAAAGRTTLVVPQAVVFHAEAAHRGVRRTPLTGSHTHFQERRAALFTLLANSPARTLPLQVVRLTLGTVLRVLGFLLVRSPGEALDELAALVSLRPRTLRVARRERAARVPGPSPDVRRLLAPWWLPYRHGLDVVGDLVGAAGNQAADVAERRRIAAAERDPESFAARRVPTSEDDDVLEADSGWVARFLSNPVAVLLAVVVLVSLVGARSAFGSVSGGALSPAPAGVGDWWGLHLESWHALGGGTAVPAPAYLVPLALLGTLLGGSASAAVSAVLLLAVPVALWGAWRLLRLLGRLVSPRGLPRWLLLWGAATYAAVPVASGAWAQGRLGVVAAAAVLPWLAHAAIGFADPEADRRWRAAWRSGVLLSLLVALAPVSWLLAVAITGLGVAAAAALAPAAARDRSAWAPPAVALALPLGLLLPWWLPSLQHRAAEGLLLGAGRLPGAMPDGLDVLTGRLGGAAAPAWPGLLLLALALLALLPRPSRIPVLLTWVLAAVTALLALVLSWVTLDVAGGSVPPSVSVLVVVLQGTLVTAAVLGALGAVEVRRSAGVPLTPLPRAVGAAVVAAAVLVPVVGLGWFATGDADLVDEIDTDVPAYMVQSAASAPERGVLVLTGSIASGVDHVVYRGDGVTVGEDEILALSPRDEPLTDLVRSLVSDPTGDVADRLAERGVEYVVLPAPADGDVASVLDATGGLVQASAEDRDTRAWRVAREPDPEALDGPGSWLRPLLLLAQLAAIVVALVQWRAHPSGEPSSGEHPMRRPSLQRPDFPRPGPLASATAAIPLVAVVAMLLTDAGVTSGDGDRAPIAVPLTSSTVVCPTGNAGGVLVASASGEAGTLGSGRGEDAAEVEVAPDLVTRLEDAAALTATGALAPGLVAQRFSSPGLRAVDCPATSSDQWFTGVGAGAEHRSVLELHNPDGGPATATITVLGQSGLVGAGGNLRGVSVPGGGTVRLDLGAEIPKREELALRVQTDRGRLAATVVDAFVPVGRGETTKEYLAGQQQPTTSNLLLGLPEDVDEPAVVVANTSDSASRVQLRLVTEDATFAPTALEEVLVDPQSVRRFSISRLLGSGAAEGVLGIEVVSSQPATASFRGLVAGDLVTVVPAGPVATETLVPVFFSGLVLGGADALGTVEVVALDRDGQEVDTRTVEIGPEVAVDVKVPARAALLRIVPRGTPVQGSLVLTAEAGSSVIGVRELVREALVPDVRPGLR